MVEIELIKKRRETNLFEEIKQFLYARQECAYTTDEIYVNVAIENFPSLAIWSYNEVKNTLKSMLQCGVIDKSYYSGKAYYHAKIKGYGD